MEDADSLRDMHARKMKDTLARYMIYLVDQGSLRKHIFRVLNDAYFDVFTKTKFLRILIFH